MTSQRPVEKIETTEQRPAVQDTAIARDDSVVEEQVVHSPAGGWNLARGWVRSLGAVIMAALAIVETLLVFRQFRLRLPPGYT